MLTVFPPCPFSSQLTLAGQLVPSAFPWKGSGVAQLEATAKCCFLLSVFKAAPCGNTNFPHFRRPNYFSPFIHIPLIGSFLSPVLLRLESRAADSGHPRLFSACYCLEISTFLNIKQHHVMRAPGFRHMNRIQASQI